MENDSIEKEFFYFLHIPKTAGTSLVNILENQFSADKVYNKVIWPELFTDLPLEFDSFDLFRGHFGYWMCDLLPRKPKIITMIRKPLEQILSLYEHQRRSFDEDDFSMLKSKDESILEVLKDGPRRRRLANHQTRNITLAINKQEIFNILNKNKKIEQSDFKEIQPRLPQKTGKELLEIAKKRISSFEFVGITEKFEESLQLLYFTFGWYPLRYVPKENVASKRVTFDSLDDEIKIELKKATRLDESLYNFGIEIFESRYSQMIDFLAKKYQILARKIQGDNDMIYDLLEKNYVESKQFQQSYYDNRLFDVKDKTIGFGWHQREFWSDKNRIIRWSGPEMESVIFFPFQLEKNIEFEIHILGSTFDLKNLKIKVNENNIPLKILKKLEENLMNKFTGRKNGAILKGTLPSSLSKSKTPFTKLTFCNEKTASFKELSKISKDSRKLGFALEKIIFKEKA
jgi:hypothetical protein